LSCQSITAAQLPIGPWLIFCRDGRDLAAIAGTVALARRVDVAVAIVFTGVAAESPPSFRPEIRRIFLGGEAAGPGVALALGGRLATLLREIGPAMVLLPAPLDPATAPFTGDVERLLAAEGWCGPGWYYPLPASAAANRAVAIAAVLEQKRAAYRDADLPLPPEAVLGGDELFLAVERLAPLAGVSALAHALVAQDRQPLQGEMPQVSVLVRTRDRPQLLAEALLSLTLQTYPALQVVVVNDGGRSVAEVVAPFRPQLAIDLIELPQSRGRSAAANVGIAAATGVWLALLDDDDIYLPEGIASLVAAVGSGSNVYYGQVEAYLYEGDGRRWLRTFGGDHHPDLMLFENQLPIIGCLLPLHQVRQVGGIDESLEVFEDWDLFLRLGAVCRFVSVDRVVAEYRSYGDSFITGKGGEQLQARGLAEIYQRHHALLQPQRLAAMQLAVKRELLPGMVERECQALLVAEREQLQARYAERLASQEQEFWTLHNAEVARLNQKLVQVRDSLLLRRDQLFISIIIVNYNGRHHLEKCLPAVFTTTGLEYEVILVDNGSADDSVAWVEEQFPQVRLIATGANLGFGRANLVGAHAARGGFIALLNSDTVVTPEWLLHLATPLLVDPAIGTTCSQLRLMARPELLNARGGGMSRLGFGYDIDFGAPYEPELAAGEPVDVLFPSGAAMLLRKQEFLDIGAFDPAFFMYHEDVDLGWRYWLLGRRVVMCPNSIVFHAFGGTTASQQGSGFRDWMGNRHNLRTLLKHYERPAALRAAARLIGLWLRTGQLRLALHALSWNVIHIRGTLRERRRLQRLRRLSDAEIAARGLIPEVPPPTPEIPAAPLEQAFGQLLPLPDLYPGRVSASSRLGIGWYPVEAVEGERVRASCALATLMMRVAPGSRGELRLSLHLPPQLRAEHPITLLCNGESHSFHLAPEPFWSSHQLPVVADEQGALALTLRAKPWIPQQLFGNGDLRKIGVLVKELHFLPEASPPPYQPTQVSVLITTFNRWPVLAVTLEALLQQSWRDYEVVVVDDGSTDGTWEHLTAWQAAQGGNMRLKTLRQENTGQGIARNHGLTLAEGELVLFLGDDIIPEADLIARHVARHRELGGPCAVVGYTRWDQAGMEVTPLLEHVNEQGQQFGYAHMVDGSDVPYTCFYTSNVSLPRAILGHEPFDPQFRTYGWEDVEVGYRLSRQGLRIVYCRGARAHHRHPMGLRDFFERQIKVGASITTLYDLHPQLMGDQPIMPPGRPPRWWPMARVAIPPLLPLLVALDQRRVRLPGRIYDLVLAVGFWLGRRQKGGR